MDANALQVINAVHNIAQVDLALLHPTLLEAIALIVQIAHQKYV